MEKNAYFKKRFVLALLILVALAFVAQAAWNRVDRYATAVAQGQEYLSELQQCGGNAYPSMSPTRFLEWMHARGVGPHELRLKDFKEVKKLDEACTAKIRNAAAIIPTAVNVPAEETETMTCFAVELAHTRDELAILVLKLSYVAEADKALKARLEEALYSLDFAYVQFYIDAMNNDRALCSPPQMEKLLLIHVAGSEPLSVQRHRTCTAGEARVSPVSVTLADGKRPTICPEDLLKLNVLEQMMSRKEVVKLVTYLYTSDRRLSPCYGIKARAACREDLYQLLEATASVPQDVIDDPPAFYARLKEYDQQDKLYGR